MHKFLKFIFGIKLYVFRTVPLSLIRSFSLYTQQWYMSYIFADSLRAISKPVWHIPLLHEQWITDDGHRNCPKHVEFYSKSKSEKLVHLVGFIIRFIIQWLPLFYFAVYFCVFRRVWSNGLNVSWVCRNEVFRWRLTLSFARTLHHLYSFQKRFYAMWSFGFAGYDNQSRFHYCVPCSRWQPKTRIIDNNDRALVQPCSLCRDILSKTPTFSINLIVAPCIFVESLQFINQRMHI